MGNSMSKPFSANMKRIPTPSAIPGCSSKTWVKFIESLNFDETASLYSAIIDNTYKLSVDACISMRNKLVQQGFNIERFYSNLDVMKLTEIPLTLLTIDCVGEVPAARLVGIETNPGPPKQNKNKNKKKTNTTVVSTVVRRAATAPNRILRPVINRPHNVVTNQSHFVRAFAEAIEDPWESGPMKLGYDCFENTVLGSAFIRGNFTVNADGSFATMLSPNVGETIFTNNAGFNTATWATSAASNAGALQNQMSEARVTSGGLRVICLFPETSAPGVLFAGTLPSTSRTNMIGYTPTTLGVISSTEIGIGSKGARACILPQDSDSFAFTQGVMSAYLTTTVIPSSVPYVAGTGFPAGTVVWYEGVINLEGLINVGQSGTGQDPTSTANSTTAADFYATPERLWSAARAILGHTTVMDATQGLISMASPSLGRTVGRIRSAFGQGSNFRQALVAGNSVRRQARQTTLMIEEAKAGYSLV